MSEGLGKMTIELEELDDGGVGLTFAQVGGVRDGEWLAVAFTSERWAEFASEVRALTQGPTRPTSASVYCDEGRHATCASSANATDCACFCHVSGALTQGPEEK